MTHGRRWESAYSYLRTRLKEARLAAGMSQLDVALRLGRPQSFISKVETDQREVHAIDLMLLAKIYRQPLEYFTIGALRDRSDGSITTADIAALEQRGVPA